MDRFLENENFIKNAREMIQILALIIIYSIIAFYNLGNRESPQQVWTGNTAVIIDFDDVTDISRFQFMTGARGGPFILYFSEDGNDWPFEIHVDGGSVFAWDDGYIGTQAKYVQILPLVPNLRIQELAFRDGHGRLLHPTRLAAHGEWIYFTEGPLPDQQYQINPWTLFDEQNLVPERSGFMNSTYFDEIYHARTGYEFLHGLQVFETTHPPMGKNFIAMGISIFGMTPFGWRIAGTLAGIMMIPLMYIFGRMMFSHIWGMFTAFIFAFDFMLFAQTRIATIDSYVTLFIIASYLCMYAYVKNVSGNHSISDSTPDPLPYSLLSSLLVPFLFLAGSGLFIGLAIASKWQGIYALIGLPFIFFPAWYSQFKKERKEAIITFGCCFIFFILLPGIVYVLSYIPFVRAMQSVTPDTGFFSIVFANQQHMFSYHSELLEGHPFSSRWWEWPLLIRPIFYYVNTVSYSVRQGISSFGNPAVWWMGIFATFYAFRTLINKKQAEYHNTIFFLLIAYGAQYVPWMFVYRATFIYHYFPSVPFVVLLIAFFFKTAVEPKYPKLIWCYAALVLGLFVLFHPVLSAAPVSVDFVRTFLRWLPAWILV